MSKDRLITRTRMKCFTNDKQARYSEQKVEKLMNSKDDRGTIKIPQSKEEGVS